MIARILARSLNFILRQFFSLRRNITIHPTAYLRGTPIITVYKSARLSIGNETLINSHNHLYHANMHTRTKLIADKAGARIIIGKNTRIHGTCIHAREKVVVGDRCLIAANTQIMDCNGHDLSFNHPEARINTTGNTKPVIIEDDVWIGLGVIILPGVRIGRGSVVGAGSVVTKNIPPMSIAAGNPAVVVKTMEKLNQD